MPMPVAWQVGYDWAMDENSIPGEIEKHAQKNGIEFGTPDYGMYLRGVEAAQNELDDE